MPSHKPYNCAWCTYATQNRCDYEDHLNRKTPCSERCRNARQQLLKSWSQDPKLKLDHSPADSAKTNESSATPATTAAAYTVQNFSILNPASINWLVHFQLHPSVGIEKLLEQVVSSKPRHGGVYSSYATSLKTVMVWDGTRFKAEPGMRVISQIVNQLRHEVSVLSTDISFANEWKRLLPHTQQDNPLLPDHFAGVVSGIKSRYLEYIASKEATNDILRLLYNMKILVQHDS